MRIIFTVLIFLSILSKSYSQETKWHYSSRCSTNYSFEALDNQVQGISLIQFQLSPNGKVIKDSTKVLKPLGFGLDEIAIATLEKMPGFPRADDKKQIRYAIPVKFSLYDVKPCEKSDYYLYKGNQAISLNESDIAIRYYVDAINLDRNNLMALKNLCLVRFSSGKNLSKANYDWEKLFNQKFITEEEYRAHPKKESKY